MTRALLAATLLFFAGSAYAADMPLKAPPAAAAGSDLDRLVYRHQRRWRMGQSEPERFRRWT